jgi:hypothetical protein
MQKVILLIKTLQFGNVDGEISPPAQLDAEDIHMWMLVQLFSVSKSTEKVLRLQFHLGPL